MLLDADLHQVIHARSGVPHEIMGLMQGKVVGNSIVIMDSFALPVQGTETRVNAAAEANEYMVEYIQGSEKVCLRMPAIMFGVLQSILNLGRKARERHRLVPFPPWIRLLAFRHRCQHSNEQSEIPRSFHRRRCPCISFYTPLSNLTGPLDRSQPHHLGW